MPVSSPSAIRIYKIVEKLKKTFLNKTKSSLPSTDTVTAFLEIWCLLKLCEMFLHSVEYGFRFWDFMTMNSFVIQMSSQMLKSYKGHSKSSVGRTVLWIAAWDLQCGFYTLKVSHSPELSWWPRKPDVLATLLPWVPLSSPTGEVLTIQSVGSQC